MADYPYGEFSIISATNPDNLAGQNDYVLIHAPGDATRTPIEIRDLGTGQIIGNPIASNRLARCAGFIATIPEAVAYAAGPGIEVLLESTAGMRNVAVESAAAAASAENAAVNAAATAAAAAQADLEARIAAGQFEGPAGPVAELTVGTVETVAGSPLDAAVVADQISTPGTLANTALTATIAGELPRALISQTEISWQKAWDSWNTAVLRNWYRANTGPKVAIDRANPITGEVVIASQADASALEGKQINGHIKINVSNVALGNFLLRGDGSRVLVEYPNTVKGLRIYDFEIDGQSSLTTERGVNGPSVTPLAGGGVTLERGNFHHLNDGFMAAGGGIYRYNWVHDPILWNEAVDGVYDTATDPHSDGIQMSSGKNSQITRNFVEIEGIEPNIISAIILNAASDVIDGVQIIENYLSGGGYTVHMLDDGKGLPTNVTLKDNRYGPGYNLGLFNYGAATPTFVNEKWADTREAIPTQTGQIVRRNKENPSDPMALGYVATALTIGGPTVWGAANEARYLRALTPGKVGKVVLNVEVSSGNISVGVYRGIEDGFNRKPGERIAFASLSCPAVGKAEIALDKAVEVRPGDYLALSCDNATASFTGFTGTATLLYGGQYWRSVTSHPLPASSPAVIAGGYRLPILAGIR